MQLGSPSPPRTPLSSPVGYQMGSQTGPPHWDGGCSQKDLKIQVQVNLSHHHQLANLVFVLSSPHSQRIIFPGGRSEGLCPHQVRDLRGSRSKADAHRAGPQGSSSGAVNRKLKVHASGTPCCCCWFFLLVYSVAILPIQSNQGEEDPKACWQPSEPRWPDLMIARMLGKDLHPGRAQAVVGRATRFWDVPSGYSSPLSPIPPCHPPK